MTINSSVLFLCRPRSLPCYQTFPLSLCVVVEGYVPKVFSSTPLVRPPPVFPVAVSASVTPTRPSATLLGYGRQVDTKRDRGGRKGRPAPEETSKTCPTYFVRRSPVVDQVGLGGTVE